MKAVPTFVPTFKDYSDFRARHSKAPSQAAPSKTLPLVTYITVCFNRELTIQRAIDSILSQTDRDFEIVVIDGGSKDKTLELLKAYGNQISHLVSEKDGGIYDAFNRGLALANGKWINFVNSDDWIEPGTLAKFRQILKNQHSKVDPDIICGKTRFLSSDGHGYIFDSAPELLHKESTIGHQAAYVKKSVFEELGLFRTDLKFASDYEFFLRCQVAGKTFLAVPEELANMSADGASDKNWPTLYKEITRVQKELLGAGIQADLHLLGRLVRTGVSRTLSKLGLEPIVTFYRKHISPLKKTRV